MTSEPSQHGWQPTDRYEPSDEAPNSRGYGLFDAPAAPDEFPSFTPFSGSGRDSEAFPPDSDPAPSSSFGGFPSDDLPAPSEWSSPVSEHYVPAPAVLPIPGVRHDMEASPASWATTSDSFAADPYPAPAAEFDRDEPSGNAASSWAAFAAGDSPKASPSGGAAWSDASAPAWEDHPLNEARRDEPSWGESPFGASAAESEAIKPVSPVAGSARVAPAAPLPSRLEPQEPAPSATAKPAGRVYGSATVAPPEPNEPSYAPPPPPHQIPAPAASGPVRASARASVNVAKPAPGEALPQTTRSSTVYGSAAATPIPPSAPPPPPMGAAGLAAPHAAAGLAAPHSAAGLAAPQAAAGAPGLAAPGQAGLRPGRQHTFGDLLGPAGTEPPPHAAPIPAQRGPVAPGAPAQGIPGPGMPGQGGPGQGMQGAPYGAPPPPPGGPGNPAAAPRATASVPTGGPAGQAAFDQFKPATTDSPQPAEQPKPERKGRIIAGVLVGCVALLALAFGGLFLVDKIFNGPSFVVGDCVKQNDNVAVRADCAEAGAFQVKEAVSSPAECQDQSQPHVQQKSQILCLAPVAATSTTGATPTPTASPNQ